MEGAEFYTDMLPTMNSITLKVSLFALAILPLLYAMEGENTPPPDEGPYYPEFP